MLRQHQQGSQREVHVGCGKCGRCGCSSLWGRLRGDWLAQVLVGGDGPLGVSVEKLEVAGNEYDLGGAQPTKRDEPGVWLRVGVFGL